VRPNNIRSSMLSSGPMLSWIAVVVVLAQPKEELLSSRPHVAKWKNFATKLESEQIMRFARPRLQPSTTFGSQKCTEDPSDESCATSVNSVRRSEIYWLTAYEDSQ
jgi:hypothetical protein